ncbi:MAG: signal peptidase I, partial [Planctomycetaceae bacterium]|nr:signal peptidase I [Planctomycetaceae bacterium]
MMVATTQDDSKQVEQAEGAKPSEKPKDKESTRDTIESILFAFVLAFMFRTFEAEAFVIPTGSMAPTLYGRHKEATCTECGNPIVVGASDEVNPETGYLFPDARVTSALCPNCGANNEQLYDALAFNGDRIIVNKYPYEFGDPERFDVFVFKFPEEPKTNYIKRLVGLPNETIRIKGGNLYLVEDGAEQVLRKPPEKQRLIQIPVHDDDHAPRELLAAGWPERWAGVKRGDIGRVAGWNETDDGWQADFDTRTYTISKDAGKESWLRYRHFFPTVNDWRNLKEGKPLDPRARLIADLCSYNIYTGSDVRHFEAVSPSGIDLGTYWVADLTLNFDLQVSEVGSKPEVLLELVEGPSWYRCRINVETGAAVLEEVNSQMNERVRELATASTPIQGAGSYSVSFANVDDRLCLWVNNRLIDFGDGALIQPLGAVGNPFPTEMDLTPLGIAASNVSATVSHLKIERDIYYRADFPQSDLKFQLNKGFQRDLERLLIDPNAWADAYLQKASELDLRTIEIGPDGYLALGDNSPRSRDSRLWREDQQAVPREFLVGQAFWI